MCHSLGSSAYKRSSWLICAHGIIGRRIRGGGQTRGTKTPGRAILTLVSGTSAQWDTMWNTLWMRPFRVVWCEGPSPWVTSKENALSCWECWLGKGPVVKYKNNSQLEEFPWQLHHSCVVQTFGERLKTLGKAWVWLVLEAMHPINCVSTP